MSGPSPWFDPQTAAAEWIDFLQARYPGVTRPAAFPQDMRGELLGALESFCGARRISTPARFRLFLREVRRAERAGTVVGRTINRAQDLLQRIGLAGRVPEDL